MQQQGQVNNVAPFSQRGGLGYRNRDPVVDISVTACWEGVVGFVASLMISVSDLDAAVSVNLPASCSRDTGWLLLDLFPLSEPSIIGPNGKFLFIEGLLISKLLSSCKSLFASASGCCDNRSNFIPCFRE